LTKSRDTVASDSRKEFDNEEKGVIFDAKDEETPSWEKKWKGNVEKATVKDLEYKPHVVSKDPEEKQGGGDGLTHRKGGVEPQKVKETKEESASDKVEFTALRKKVRTNHWAQMEFLARQLIIVLMAVLSAVYFVKLGGLVEASDLEGVGSIESEAHRVLDESDDGEVVFDLEDDTEDSVKQVIMYTMEPPGGGYWSIPISLLFLRIGLVMGVSLVGDVGVFDLLNAGSSGGSGNGWMVKQATAFVPQLGVVLKVLSVLRTTLDDVILFVVLFVLLTACLVS